MNEIIDHLQASIQDEVFSKSEKKDLKTLIAEHNLDSDQLHFLRSKVYELAEGRATPSNYAFILAWMKNALNALLPTSSQPHSEAFFSPGDDCRKAIIQAIGGSQRRIDICVFTISDDAITSAILVAHKKGVPIKIITDNDKSEDVGSDIDRLAHEGVAVRVDRTSNHMHHKFMVVDDSQVITGSYNWTLSAAKFNHENILLTREAGIIKAYVDEFNMLWGKMEKLGRG
ncbi:MAG: DUF1669 domain-containing protein [Cyclobacteriaceae bacterium]|nr:DUF1669 domain-containing protein [Cyclobacteriaceae bacterium]